MDFDWTLHATAVHGLPQAKDLGTGRPGEYAEKQNGPRDRRDELIHIECLNEKGHSPLPATGSDRLQAAAALCARHNGSVGESVAKDKLADAEQAAILEGRSESTAQNQCGLQSEDPITRRTKGDNLIPDGSSPIIAKKVGRGRMKANPVVLYFEKQEDALLFTLAASSVMSAEGPAHGSNVIIKFAEQICKASRITAKGVLNNT